MIILSVDSITDISDRDSIAGILDVENIEY